MTTEVTQLRWRPFRLPMRNRIEAASGAVEDREGVVIELTGADGSRGYGEASPMPSLGGGAVGDVLELLQAHGASVAAPATLSSLPDAPGVAALRCALDVALLDLEGRARGVSIASLLAGEQSADWVAVNAMIAGVLPHEVANFGVQAVEQGYSVLKVKVGAESLEDDLRRLEALRAACPEATIRLDANGAWDEAGAQRAIDAFYPIQIELLEQPVPAPDVEALARVHEHASLRVAADEAVDDAAALEQILERQAADLLVLKPMVLGGLRPALQLAQRAADASIGAFVTTTFDSSIGIAAALHLAAALPADAAHGLGTGEHLGADVVANTLLPRDGQMAVPDAPGLGIEVDDAVLEAVATAGWSTAPA